MSTLSIPWSQLKVIGFTWSLSAISTYVAGIRPGGHNRSIHFTNSQPSRGSSSNFNISPLLTLNSFEDSAVNGNLVTTIMVGLNLLDPPLSIFAFGLEIVRDLNGVARERDVEPDE
ncbi:unnamed protein product [Candida parapsilosis]